MFIPYSKFLLRRDVETHHWELPGGEGWEEEKGVGWDVGARIGSLQEITQTQLGLEVPWMSYIEDVEEAEGICRVYGFSDENLDTDALANGGYEWFTKSELKQRLGEVVTRYCPLCEHEARHSQEHTDAPYPLQGTSPSVIPELNRGD